MLCLGNIVTTATCGPSQRLGSAGREKTEVLLADDEEFSGCLFPKWNAFCGEYKSAGKLEFFFLSFSCALIKRLCEKKKSLQVRSVGKYNQVIHAGTISS